MIYKYILIQHFSFLLYGKLNKKQIFLSFIFLVKENKKYVDA